MIKSVYETEMGGNEFENQSEWGLNFRSIQLEVFYPTILYT